jgi:hypothetical protein
MSDKIIKYRLFDAASLASLGVLTTPTIDLRSIKNLQSLRIKATSVSAQGSIDFAVDMAVSDYAAPPNKPDFVTAPVEDYDAFTTSIITSYKGTPLATDWQVFAMPSPLMPFIKLRFTGIGTNPTDTLVTAKLIVQESL